MLLATRGFIPSYFSLGSFCCHVSDDEKTFMALPSMVNSTRSSS
jgi:hypothetical protein